MTREAGPVKGGKTVIAFVEDPTGYKVGVGGGGVLGGEGRGGSSLRTPLVTK